MRSSPEAAAAAAGVVCDAHLVQRPPAALYHLALTCAEYNIYVWLLQIAAYETFLRRMIRRAPGAALLAVAAFDFTSMGLSLRDSWGPPTASNMTRLRPYYNSGEFINKFNVSQALRACTLAGLSQESSA